jgi:hypothetical protein
MRYLYSLMAVTRIIFMNKYGYCALDSAREVRKCGLHRGASRHDHQIIARRHVRQLCAHHLSQPAFYPVSYHGVADFSADRQPES